MATTVQEQTQLGQDELARRKACTETALTKLQIAQSFVNSLFSEEEKINPMVYWALFHLNISFDESINSASISVQQNEYCLEVIRREQEKAS